MLHIDSKMKTRQTGLHRCLLKHCVFVVFFSFCMRNLHKQGVHSARAASHLFDSSDSSEELGACVGCHSSMHNALSFTLLQLEQLS